VASHDRALGLGRRRHVGSPRALGPCGSPVEKAPLSRLSGRGPGFGGPPGSRPVRLRGGPPRAPRAPGPRGLGAPPEGPGRAAAPRSAGPGPRPRFGTPRDPSRSAPGASPRARFGGRGLLVGKRRKRPSRERARPFGNVPLAGDPNARHGDPLGRAPARHRPHPRGPRLGGARRDAAAGEVALWAGASPPRSSAGAHAGWKRLPDLAGGALPPRPRGSRRRRAPRAATRAGEAHGGRCPRRRAPRHRGARGPRVRELGPNAAHVRRVRGTREGAGGRDLPGAHAGARRSDPASRGGGPEPHRRRRCSSRPGTPPAARVADLLGPCPTAFCRKRTSSTQGVAPCGRRRDRPRADSNGPSRVAPVPHSRSLARAEAERRLDSSWFPPSGGTFRAEEGGLYTFRSRGPLYLSMDGERRGPFAGAVGLLLEKGLHDLTAEAAGEVHVVTPSGFELRPIPPAGRESTR
jgi:hypothetical protein